MSINSSFSDLLDHVQGCEASLSPLESAYFGHPPPPALLMVQVTGDNYVLAAQTNRCVSAQLYQQDGDLFICKSEPIEVFRLESSNDKENEEITCATLLCLDPSLQKDDENSSRSVALVLGTDQNRVLAVQMKVLISMDGNLNLVCDRDEPPFEPLPVDRLDFDKDRRGSDSLTTSSHGKSSIADSSRHGRRSISDLSRHGSAHGSPVPINAFCPQGGVVALSLYCIPTRLLWISYRDGTIVRLHHAALFSSSAVNEEAAPARDIALATIRFRVALPLSFVENESMTVLPLPKYHPSPLAPLAHDGLDMSEEEEEEKKEAIMEFQEALAFGGSGSPTGGDDFLPAITFFTSENQFAGRIAGNDLENYKRSNHDGDLVGNVVGGTVAVVGGVLGAAFGAVKWSLGAKKGDDEKISGDGHPGNDQTEIEKSFLLALHKGADNLFSGFEIQDAPRQVTSVTVDPTGNLAAAADNLGRVLLIDLSSKQVIRMWKGVRESSCYWIYQPVTGGGSLKPDLFLAIHSRQRSILDIWSCRYGPKVMSMKLDRDAIIISIGDTAAERLLTNCFVLQPHQRGGKSINKLDPRQFVTMGTPQDAGEDKSPTDSLLKKTIQTSAQESALQLQLLRQLLAKTHLPREAHDVFETFTQITSMNDLGSALDVLAGADQLEESMGVEGAEFHASAVQHCRAVLDETVQDAGSTAKNSSLVKQFESKIVFHEQVVEAYGVLRKFEMGEANESVDEERVRPSSPWAIEAMSWIATYEAVTRTSIDTGAGPSAQAPLRFSAFGKACASAGQTKPGPDSPFQHKIYFREGAPTRNKVLIHVFRPLLKDIFKIRVVDSIFSLLGVSQKDQGNIDYLLKCFGDWFMNMSVREASRSSFFVSYSPLVRWLNDVVGNELEITMASEPKPEILLVLKALSTFCSECDDLVRAFLLSSLCHEAVTSAAKKQEDRTYGLVSQSQAVTPWRQLLRKLRMCLLVSLRLNGVHLGSFPITVKNVEAGDIFSVYQWLAHDELRMSHRHEEIVSLEKACYLSGLSFDPSSEAGDNPKRLKMLHQACLAAAISEAEKEEYLLDMNDDDLLGALLLYLKSYNNPTFLVAHRALLLANQWQRKPSEITILDDCLDALRAIEDGERMAPLQAGAMLEVWQSAVRPLYRAVFFGFDDVHELDRDEISPLLEEELFLKQLGHRSLVLLNLLSAKYSAEGKSTINWSSALVDDDSTGWPPVREDFILKEVVNRLQPIDRKTLDMHRIVVCGTLLSGDLQALSECVPDIYNAFLPTSLFNPVGGGETTTSEVSEKQMDFLEHAVIARAREMQRSTFLDRLDLGEIESLTNLWNVDLRDVRTMFLLVMYELGKDSLVDQQLTMSTERNTDLDRLLQDGIGIACRRLNRVLNGNRSPQIRGIIGLLDADTCEFVREEAAISEPLVEEEKDAEVSLSSAHLFVLRLLTLASTTGEKQNLVKIHSLSILSGTLMKAMEQKS